MKNWTFLTNHALVLSLIAKHPNITANEMAMEIGITERSIRSIIADLAKSNFITKQRIGRGVRYKINGDLKLRHRTHREIAVGDFLRTLGWEKNHIKQVKTRII
jgi:DNA-binding transcriptional ArsR family regulator